MKTLALIASLVLATAFAYQTPPINLPLEVYGSGGPAEVTVMLDISAPPSALCFRAHQAGRHFDNAMYFDGWATRDDAASVRVGSSAFVGNWNDTAVYVEGYQGVGGVMHTQWICIGASAFGGQLQQGTVPVTFRFDGDNIRSGYRIVDLDVRTGTTPNSGSSVLATDFTYEDPMLWTAPTGGNAMNGQALWEMADLVEPDGTAMDPRVSCASCHAPNGYDLSYYAYSNKVIGARTQAHGLTEQDGRDIAAYIRQHNAENPYARPWISPFQPAVGMTDRGAEWWAAGSEAVLASDDEMPQYLFPNGTSTAAMDQVFSHGTWDSPDGFGNIINIQNIPVAIQFPDWNSWLPDIHPIDAYGYEDITSNEVWGRALQLETAYDTPAQVQEVINRDRAYLVCTGGCGASGFGDLLRFSFDLTSNMRPQLDIVWSERPADYFLAGASLLQWMNVRMWSEMQQNDLFDLGERLHNGLVTPSPWRGAGGPLRLLGSPLGDQDPPFFWPGQTNSVYGVAPHINSRCDNCSAQYPQVGMAGNHEGMNTYMSAVWYDLQQVISSEMVGMPSNNGGAPTDLNYTTDHNRGAQAWSGESHFWRMFTRRAVASQSRNNYYTQATTQFGYAFNGGPGFTATNANYWEAIGRYPNETGLQGRNNRLAADQILSWRALSRYWNAWATFARSVPNDWWVREPEPTGMYEPANVVPQSFGRFDPYTDADNAYVLGELMAARNLEGLDNFARWGESMWPLGNFEQWFESAPPPPPPPTNIPPVVAVTQPQSGDAVGRDHVARADASDPDGEIASVTFVGGKDGEPEQEYCVDTTAPYECSISVATAGKYLIRAFAIDNVGALTWSDQVKYRVRATGRNNTLFSYALEHDAHVVVEIIDVLGRIVATVESGWRSAGHYQPAFTVDLPDGHYFVRITKDDVVEVRRMTVARNL